MTHPIIFIILLLTITLHGPSVNAAAFPLPVTQGDSARAKPFDDSAAAGDTASPFTAYRFTFGLVGDYGINAGFGTEWMLGYQRNHLMLAAKYQLFSSLNSGGFDSPVDHMREFAGLVGWVSMRRQTYVSFSGGLSYRTLSEDFLRYDSVTNRVVTDAHSYERTLAIPMLAELMLLFEGGIGTGISIFGSLDPSLRKGHRAFLDYGFGFVCHVGTWDSRAAAAVRRQYEARQLDSVRYAGPRAARSSIYLELFGSADILSVHYDRLLTERQSASIGIGLVGLVDPNFDRELTVPLSWHYFTLSQNDGGFECAFGYALDIKFAGRRPAQINPGYITSMIGYRFQDFDGGEFLRIGLAPMIMLSSVRIIPFWFGVSGGVTF